MARPPSTRIQIQRPQCPNQAEPRAQRRGIPTPHGVQVSRPKNHRHRTMTQRQKCSRKTANITLTGATAPADGSANPFQPANAPHSATKKNRRAAHPKPQARVNSRRLLRALSAGVSRHDCATRYAAQALIDSLGTVNPADSAPPTPSKQPAPAPRCTFHVHAVQPARRTPPIFAIVGRSGAPKLDTTSHAQQPRALGRHRHPRRNRALKNHAPETSGFHPLCADLAIRSGTAVKLSPAEYDAHAHPQLLHKERRARRPASDRRNHRTLRRLRRPKPRTLHHANPQTPPPALCPKYAGKVVRATNSARTQTLRRPRHHAQACAARHAPHHRSRLLQTHPQSAQGANPARPQLTASDDLVPR